MLHRKPMTHICVVLRLLNYPEPVKTYGCRSRSEQMNRNG